MTQTQSIILIADQKVLNIPIQECHEPLLDLKDQSKILYGPSPEIDNNFCYTQLRSTIYTKLIQAQNHLPPHLRLCLYEGLRAISLQEYLFKKRWDTIKMRYREWSDHDLYQEVIKMVSPVTTLDGKQNIPPHSTGAAVDIYLVDAKTHLPVEMGILAKDWMQDTDGILSYTDSTVISEEAKKNRSILSEAMIGAGFVNYPTEYWHWSYGDRYWSFIQGEPHAFYGPVTDF